MGSGGVVGGIWQQLREIGNGIACCVCFFCCAGPVLFFIGVGFLISAGTNSRDDLISEYNTAVEAWVNNYYEAFSTGTYAIESPYLDTTALVMDTSDSDHLLDTDLTGVSTYTGYQVRYAYTGAVFSGLSFSYETQPTVTQDVTLFGAVTPTGSDNTLPVTGIELLYNLYMELPSCHYDTETAAGPEREAAGRGLQQSTQSCFQACRNANGLWDDYYQECYDRTYLTDMCFKVEVSVTRDSITLDDSYGGLGCAPSLIGTWGPGVYARPTSLDQTQVDFSSMTTLIRNANDPYVYAAYITNGSYRFGLSTSQKLQFAFIFIAVGGAITVCVCGGTFCLLRCCYRSATGYSDVSTKPYTGPSSATAYPGNNTGAPVATYQQQPTYAPAPAPVPYGQPTGYAPAPAYNPNNPPASNPYA